MRIILMFIVFLSSTANVFAGKITGKITDEKTGEAVIGAVIAVKNTDKGSVSDVDGNYFIEIADGIYVLDVKYAGYTTKEVENVVVKGGEPTQANITIKESTNSQTLEEVVVRSSLKKENINALYTIQKNAASVSDGISADVIRRSPDRSTGEVLKRVSGTTIQDNKFVIVRGLTDRYNTALVDNAILPSTEPNRKAFSFDIIPSAMIDNIVITKSATPDLPGDFAGGVINILTKETPDVNYNSISIGGAYNTVSTGKDFKSGYRSSTDIIGFDNGARKLPGSFPSSNQIELSGMSSQQKLNALQSLNNDYAVRSHSAFPGVNMQAALGRAYRIKNGDKIGLTAAITYNHTENIKPNLIREYDNLVATDNIYTYSTNIGALLNAGYYFGGNKIVFKTLYNRIFDDNFLYREGFDLSSGNNIRYYAFDLVQKSLFKTSLDGEHSVGKSQSKIGWQLSYNNVLNDQPDQRKALYFQNPSDNIYYANNGTLGKANSRLFGHLNENIFNGNAYYSMPFKMFENKNSLKIGAFGQLRQRDFRNRYLGATFNSGILNPETEQGYLTRDINTLYAEDAISSGAYELRDQTMPEDAYKATATTLAGYVMLDNKFSEKIRLVWGARYESYSLDLKAPAPSTLHIQPSWGDILPSANFTYSLNEKSNLRASYFRSVARPELRESSPVAYYDYELNSLVNGNPNLTRSRINNFDVRYEMYPKAGEIFSVSLFYKHFDKTIENRVYGISNYEIIPTNYKSATNAGIEAELRKNLGFIASNTFFSNLSFYINAAYIQSKVKLDVPQNINGKDYSVRPLAGQSPYTINTSLSYAAWENKFNLNVLYNRIGERLFLVGADFKGNVYESPRNLLDFQASYNISKKSELRLNIKDLLNNPARLYFDQDNNGKFERQEISRTQPIHVDGNKDWIFQEYKPGTTFSLTYTYRF